MREPASALGFTRDKKAVATTTDFAKWRDWRQVRVVISRRGHDISCPYEFKGARCGSRGQLRRASHRPYTGHWGLEDLGQALRRVSEGNFMFERYTERAR